jgi:hypothetical protein
MTDEVLSYLERRFKQLELKGNGYSPETLEAVKRELFKVHSIAKGDKNKLVTKAPKEPDVIYFVPDSPKDFVRGTFLGEKYV